jgi:hypothetical protein
MFLPVASSNVHTMGSGGEAFNSSGTGATPSPCSGMTMKWCCFLAFSGIGKQKTWSTSFHAMANSTLPLAPMALMPPSFLSSSSRVNFFRWGMATLTAGYVLNAFVAVLVRLPPDADAPFCGGLLSSILRFFVAGSAAGCEV